MRIAVIGGGASGMMCAALLIENGCSPVIFEKNEKCGRKLAITGKGRCNVTNACDRELFISNIPTNPRFLYSAYSGFSNHDTMAFFENHGVPLKIERGKRVFPVSDRAYDIVDSLYRIIKRNVKNERVTDVIKSGNEFYINTGSKSYIFDSVVIATGGLSYPLTGSTGDGYRFAEKMGIAVTSLSPSLVPLVASCSNECASAMGLTLKNVAVSLYSANGNKLFSDFGELLFTHFGVSGPIVLSASAHINNSDLPCVLRIDLKPSLDEKALDIKLLAAFSESQRKEIRNSLSGILPSKIIDLYLLKCGIDPAKKCCSITKEERTVMVETLKSLCIEISGKSDFSQAVITRGGVDVNELWPSSMESRKIENLYFIGEIIDVDGYTGGFNLQIAFSTAAACARDIIKKTVQ